MMSKLDQAIEKLEELIFEMDNDGRNKYFVELAEDILGILNEAKYGEEEESADDEMEVYLQPKSNPKHTRSPKVGTSSVG